MASTTKKDRADFLVHAQGLSESREKARVLILAGKIYVREQRVEKAGDKWPIDTVFSLRGEALRFVSRGGLKLEGALIDFKLDVTDLVVADFGASTGGFSDCVLSRGASRVYAIDVGYGQLHEKLRQDARVISHERMNARHLHEASLPELVDLVVIDASFIGLGKLLEAACRVSKPSGQIVAMVKPQFEAGPENLRNGVVVDEAVRQSTIAQVVKQAESFGLSCQGRHDSVIRGPEGNQETFLRLTKSFA